MTTHYPAVGAQHRGARTLCEQLTSRPRLVDPAIAKRGHEPSCRLCCRLRKERPEIAGRIEAAMLTMGRP